MASALFRIFSESDSGARVARALADRFQGTLHDGDRIPRRGPALRTTLIGSLPIP